LTNHPPSVLWHCWLGHQTCKNRRPYNLYCVGADVKPCSIPTCKLLITYTEASLRRIARRLWKHRAGLSAIAGLHCCCTSGNGDVLRDQTRTVCSIL